MKKIRIGKDVEIKWTVTIAGQAITSEDDLTLVLSDTFGKEDPLPFEISSGKAVCRILGKNYHQLGRYMLTMWYNYGKEGQSAVDHINAFQYVSTTDKEAGEDSDNITTSTVNLSGNINIGVPGRDGKINGYNEVTITGEPVSQSGSTITINAYSKANTDSKLTQLENTINSKLNTVATNADIDALFGGSFVYVEGEELTFVGAYEVESEEVMGVSGSVNNNELTI